MPSMPKITLPPLPLSAVFAVAKPSGPTSMSVVESLKPLLSKSRLFATDAERAQASSGKRKKKFNKGKPTGVKIGTGGTLDPLADGVLVLGVNDATKKLGGFLDCTKEYRTTCLLGAETNSYDSEGRLTRTARWTHVTRPAVEAALERFRGEIVQVPPLYSALKMDGKPLYEYARSGIPLPRPIEGRRVTVHALSLEDFVPPSDHTWKFPTEQMSAEERANARTAFANAKVVAPGEDEAQASGIDEAQVAPEDEINEGPGPAVVLRMTVSGGTYVRSIAHDLGRALGSAAHVVTLTRTRQKTFTLDDTENEDAGRRAVPWDVFERAFAAPTDTNTEECDADGWTEWERAVLDAVDDVESRKK